MGGFCKQLGTDVNAVEQKCNTMDPDVCASTECCALLGGSKCVAGNVNGPLVASNYSDFTIQNRDFYYFQGKCYGNCYQNGASSMYKPLAKSQFPATDATGVAKAFADAAAAKPAPAAAAKIVAVGSIVDAILYLQSGLQNDAVTFKATITTDVDSTTWGITWNEGPKKDLEDKISKDTLQVITKQVITKV
jgi:hypothetical protein